MRITGTHQAPRWSRIAPIALCLAALVLPAFAEKTEEPKAPEPLETELVGIRTAIINASAKLKNKIVGISDDRSERPPTPAQTCCALSVKKIEERVARAKSILEAMDRCYEIEGDQSMLLDGRVAQSDLHTFEVTVPQFRDAPTREKAQAGIDAMTRTYILLRESSVKLRACERTQTILPPQTDEQSED
jgi:hypothetical protein